MNETLIRAISGFAYVVLLLATLFFSKEAFTALLFIFAAISCWELNRILNIKGIRAYIQLVFLFYFIAFQNTTPALQQVYLIFTILTILSHLYLSYTLFKMQKINDNSFIKQQLPLLYISIPIGLFALTPSLLNDTYTPTTVLGVLIIIWANDTFAYLIGKNWGKHKLFEKISPKKTIEGFLGGAIFGVITAVILSYTTHIESLSTTHWVIISLISAVFGAIGDLVASKFKREANIKDSSSLIPGHGGFLDRLDSLIFVAPFIYLYFQLINYVS